MSDFYSDFFSKTDAKRAAAAPVRESSGSSSGYMLSGEKKKGTLICRWIKDKNGVPFCYITNLWEMWLPRLDEDGNEVTNKDGDVVNAVFVVPDISNYITPLTVPQIALYDEVVALMTQVNDIEELEMNYREYSEMFLFYAKPLRFSLADGTSALDKNQKAMLFRHGSARFYTSLQSTMKTKREVFQNTTWFEDYVSRIEGVSTNPTIITTSKQIGKDGKEGIGYAVVIGFESNIQINVTAEDLELADNINHTPYCEIDIFPEEKFVRARTQLTNILAGQVESVEHDVGAQSVPTAGVVDTTVREVPSATIDPAKYGLPAAPAGFEYVLLPGVPSPILQPAKSNL